MGDPRRFWKESIGVTGPVGPSTGTVPRREPAAAATTAPPRPRPGAPPPPSASIPPVEQVLAMLPIGSIVFADEVGRKLWPNPSAQELKALALLIEHQHRLPPPVRELAFRSVSILQRMRRLGELTARATFDTTPLKARGAEWSRLARLARETAEALTQHVSAGGESPAIAAARELLPDAADLEALAAVAAEAAELAETARSEPDLDPLAVCDIPDATALVAALQSGAPRPGDELFLEIFAAAHLARNATSVEVLGRARRAMTILSERLESAISRSLSEHRRDPQRNARQAEWKRCLADVRGRVDEALTRPAAPRGRTSPHAGPVTGPAEPTGPAGASNATDPADDAIRTLLSEVREKVGPAPPKPEPASIGSMLRRLFSRRGGPA